MRFMVIVKATAETEAGVMPTEAQLRAMTEYNEQLVNAGIMLAGEGLHPSSKGTRVQFGDAKTVVDGPFAETKELIAGFWIWEVASKAEALEWLKRAPFEDGEVVELRQVFSADDFGDELTPELREQERKLREKAAALQS